MSDYRPRLIDGLLGRLLSELPGVLLVGPRAAGKTTTAAQHARSIVRLDNEPQAAAFRLDPDAALHGLEEPILIDEWQQVPAVLGAIKRSIDADPRGGRFLVTGSVRADLTSEGWPATGRLVRVPLYGMTIREQLGQVDKPSFIDRVVDGDPLTTPPEVPNLFDYVEMALRGGFPEPVLRLSPAGARRWLNGYVDQLLTRDAPELDGGRDPILMQRYAVAYALNSAGVVDDRTLYDAAGIDRRTALAYERLLANLMVIESVPAWSDSRLKRLALAPKRYVVDPALMAALLNVDVSAVMRDGHLIGRLIDTFVASQLRAELTISDSLPRLYHLRHDRGRSEVDLLAELGAGRVVGFEVKATAAPRRDDARHLVWLREQLGDRFIAGVVFHTGPRVFRLDDSITAVPICALWG